MTVSFAVPEVFGLLQLRVFVSAFVSLAEKTETKSTAEISVKECSPCAPCTRLSDPR